jgi:hypothetical protein
MKNGWIVTALTLSAAVHLLPASGLFSSAQLTALYGPAAADTSVQLLLKHRALLFGLLALLCAAAVVWPSLRGVALVLACGSVAGFLLLAGRPDSLTPALQRVFWVDAALLPVLLLALVLHGWSAVKPS